MSFPYQQTHSRQSSQDKFSTSIQNHDSGLFEEYSVPKDLGKLQKGFAPITSADFFKSEAMLRAPKSTVEVTRFLSREARLRTQSSLKASSAGIGNDVISLSTGRPSPDTYPFHQVDFEFTDACPLADPQSKFQQETGLVNLSPRTSRKASVARDDPESAIDLSVALSYGYSLGSEQLVQFLTSHMAHVHSPQYSDWELCLTIGSTSALEIAFRNLADHDDFILTEEYTYSGTIEAAKPLGINLVPIAMDVDGLCPKSLENILSSWSTFYPSKSRPKILYTIPTGQNPTGITQPLARRREVLKIVEKYDLLIIEDDPYHYLYFGLAGFDSVLNLAPPSYFSLSSTGRVLRLDTTSKILAPGLRLGWLTAPKALVQTFQAANDLGIVHPSGLSQVIVYKLLSESWGHSGFLQWLEKLAKLYHQKAVVITSAMEQNLSSGDLGSICTWTKIEAGMFIWLKINCSTHPWWRGMARDVKMKFQRLSDIEDDIYEKALAYGVLCCKGRFFRVPVIQRASSKAEFDTMNKDDASRVRSETDDLSVHFRLAFASVDGESLVKAIERLARALVEIFGLTCQNSNVEVKM